MVKSVLCCLSEIVLSYFKTPSKDQVIFYVLIHMTIEFKAVYLLSHDCTYYSNIWVYKAVTIWVHYISPLKAQYITSFGPLVNILTMYLHHRTDCLHTQSFQVNIVYVDMFRFPYLAGLCMHDYAGPHPSIPLKNL